MAFIDTYGDEWLSEKTYRGYKKKLKQYKKWYRVFRLKGETQTESNKIYGNILCEMCANRKACTRSYRGDKVCQNCNLEMIDGYRHL